MTRTVRPASRGRVYLGILKAKEAGVGACLLSVVGSSLNSGRHACLHEN
jgi:hypothetical protein